jgi:hypothetical protein
LRKGFRNCGIRIAECGIENIEGSEQKAKAAENTHGDKSLIQFVIPGLARNPVFSWIPAFAGMTFPAAITVAGYEDKTWGILD